MEKYIWIFPLLFIFHDMEEIIGIIPWYQKNQQTLKQKYPKIISLYNNTSTEGFAFAVFEELVFCITTCVISLLSGWYGLWFGTFIACTLHFAIHIIQSLIIKSYIPALITSIIALPIGLIVIHNSLQSLNYSIELLLIYSILGIIIILINLKFAHKIMEKFTIWQTKKYM